MSIFLDQFNILLLIHLNESLLQVEDGMLAEDGRGMGESASNRTGDDERKRRSCLTGVAAFGTGWNSNRYQRWL